DRPDLRSPRRRVWPPPGHPHQDPGPGPVPGGRGADRRRPPQPRPPRRQSGPRRARPAGPGRPRRHHPGGRRATARRRCPAVPLPATDGRRLDIPGPPARHGPPGGDRGPVTGFVLAFRDAPERAVYVAGDTVWYEGVAEVATRFAIAVVLLNLGAARVPAVGP